jgi:N-acetylglucosamine kinase-like BadF-type ATPase
MRYKEHTVRKLEAQATKIKTLQRSIQTATVTGENAIEILEDICKEIERVVERLELEPNE